MRLIDGDYRGIEQAVSRENVSIPARLAYATTLRRLAAGLITTCEHESAYFRISKFYGSDDAVAAIWERVIATYGDFHDGKLRGRHAWSRETKRYVSQCILLLRTSRQHEACEWPADDKIAPGKQIPFVTRCVLMAGWIALVLAPVVFLCAGLVWPALVGIAAWGVFGLTLAISHEIQDRRMAAFEVQPPFNVVSAWPFATRGDLAAARRHPTYLCGDRPVSIA
ncbi:MAG: hypothetical protein KF691_10225 [Phycisphaeraceae bacterium]|nr:hypothetical protein [Phycisphaeraceae bacterium]